MNGFAYQPKCKKVSLDKLIVTPSGTFEPLCQSCTQRDCGNPIEPRKVSIRGIEKAWRLYINHGAPQVVVDCEAYVKKEEPTQEKK